MERVHYKEKAACTMFIDDALNLTYAYVKGKCDEYDLNIITK